MAHPGQPYSGLSSQPSPLSHMLCFYLFFFYFLFQYEYFNAVLINERDKDGNFLELGKEFILAPNDHFNNLPVNISLSDVQVPTNMYNKGKTYCCWSLRRWWGKSVRGRGGWFGIVCFFEKCSYKPSVSSIGSIGELCASSAWRL